MLIADAGHQNILGFSQLNLPLRENQNVSILVNLDNDTGFTRCVAKTSRVPTSSFDSERTETRERGVWHVLGKSEIELRRVLVLPCSFYYIRVQLHTASIRFPRYRRSPILFTYHGSQLRFLCFCDFD